MEMAADRCSGVGDRTNTRECSKNSSEEVAHRHKLARETFKSSAVAKRGGVAPAAAGWLYLSGDFGFSERAVRYLSRASLVRCGPSFFARKPVDTFWSN